MLPDPEDRTITFACVEARLRFSQGGVSVDELTCKYCESTMHLVAPGINLQDIDNPPSEGWVCPNCDARVIPGFTPDRGACLSEMPIQSVNSLALFADHLNSFIAEYLGESSDEENYARVRIVCTHDLDEEEPEDRLYDEAFGKSLHHSTHGDSLDIQVCGFSSVSIFFDGFGVVHKREPVQVFELGRPPEWVDQNTSYKFECKEMADLHTKVDDLILGQPTYWALEAMAQGCESWVCKEEAKPLCDRGIFYDFVNLSDFILGQKVPKLNKLYPAPKYPGNDQPRLVTHKGPAEAGTN